MSVIVVEGIRWASDLTWQKRASAWRTGRTARQLGASMTVHTDLQTGFAQHGHAESLPPLALALADHIPQDSWCALVEGEDDRWAVISCTDGQILSNGDQTFTSRDAAIAAFDEARIDDSWGHYASRDVVAGAVDLDTDHLSPRGKLEPAPFRNVTAGRVGGMACLSTLPITAIAGWMMWTDIKHLLWGPPPPPPRAAPPPEPTVRVSIDGSALLAGCREAIRRRPPSLPGWRRIDLRCTARFADSGLTKIRGELAGRPVLSIQWRLASGHTEPLWRRVAESHFESWAAQDGVSGSVTGQTAWAVVPLPPVATAAATPKPPSVLAIRRAIDERFGLQASRIKGSGTARMEVLLRAPLERIASLIEDLDGLEIPELREHRDGWTVHIRRTAPITMPESQLAQLRRAQ